MTPLDVLILINWINTKGSGTVPTSTPNPADSALFPDVNGDNFISPIDVLAVINYINGRPPSTQQAAEGEGIAACTAHRVTPVPHTEITEPLRSRVIAVDRAFRREADLSSPADWDELLDVLARGSRTRTWGTSPAGQ